MQSTYWAFPFNTTNLRYAEPIVKQKEAMRASKETDKEVSADQESATFGPTTVSLRYQSSSTAQRTVVPAPPTTTRCFPSQLLGASLRRWRMTVLLCRRLVMSYHAEVMS
jgi:hypothetical protein